MARQSRWWRTRTLFPRTTAFSIQARRAPHHARLRVRSFFESPSLWTTSVLAGLLAGVLTVLLFVAGPPPEVALKPAGTSQGAPESDPQEPPPAPRIALSVRQGAFPISWDEDEQLLVHSQPALAPSPIDFGFAGSGWRRAQPLVTASLTDTPGPVAGQLVLRPADDPPPLDSSDLPSPSPQITSDARFAVSVEKNWLSAGEEDLQEYALTVRNLSTSAVEQVVVREIVPDINQLVDVQPPASLSRGGELMWQLGAMDPGAELVIHVSYLPAEAGLLETHAVADVQSRIGVVTLVSEPFTPEPAVAEPEMPLPDAVLPAGLAGDPAPLLPADPILPADDEAPPQPLNPPLRDLFPEPAADPEPATDTPPALVMPATPALPEEPTRPEWPALDRNEPLEPRPRPLVESVPLQPLLHINSTSPDVVTRGDVVTTVYEISNEGTAAAENVTLTVHLTGELLHRYGAAVKHTVERLEPGETRRARLLTRARESGTATLDAALTQDGENVDSELSYIRVTTAEAAQTAGDWSTSETTDEEPAASPGEILR